MPLMDVTDIILDLDFVDTASYTRLTQTINSHGIASESGVTTPIYGVCTSDKGDNINRIAEGSYVSGTILFTTKARLIAGSPGFNADILTWNDRQYTVVNVKDYSRYGEGFVEATCTLIPLSG